jgi:hypothetical protein
MIWEYKKYSQNIILIKKTFSFLGKKGMDVTNPSSSFSSFFCYKGKVFRVLKLSMWFKKNGLS